MIDIVLRCFSRARWLAVATNRGIIDANGNPNPGFSVDEIGNLVLTPAVIDANGNVITPAVMDTWWTVNLRLTGQVAGDDEDAPYPGEESDTSGYRFTRSKLVAWVRNQATLKTLPYRGQTVRVYEFGTLSNRVQVLDPRDYAIVNAREWLGGQSY